MCVNDDRGSKKTETKIQRDLKELIDRHVSIFGSSTAMEQHRGSNNPLQSFFVDEMSLTKRTLNLIRADVETSRLEDAKV